MSSRLPLCTGHAAPAAVLAPAFGLSLCLALAGPAAALADTRRSGLEVMSPATQALQLDDKQNPAWLWLKAGEQRFAADCQTCHSTDSPPRPTTAQADAQAKTQTQTAPPAGAKPAAAPHTPISLHGVATRYPAWDAVLGKPVTLAGRINQCQQRHKRQSALALEGDALLGLETYVAQQSRGQAIAPPQDTRLAPWRAQGAALWAQRMGQIDLSCAQCHDQNAGGRLAGSSIPQGHPTAYPIYRLEWQTLGSLQRRLRNCMTGVRAEPYAFGADELTALELYLMQRAAGMIIETPGVRP